MPRKYSMERRSASLEETRDRIVEATMALHEEKGILATTMQEIAGRAGVSLGTVYRHFPTVDDLIPACGGRILELKPPPTPEVFASLEGADRLRALLSALYAHYEIARRPYEVGFAEAPHLPVLQALMEELQAYLRQLCVEASRPMAPSEQALGVLIAMADFYAWMAFERAGFTTDAAAAIAGDVASGVIAGQVREVER
jgi:AcrR family transcriptional regulator